MKEVMKVTLKIYDPVHKVARQLSQSLVVNGLKGAKIHETHLAKILKKQRLSLSFPLLQDLANELAHVFEIGMVPLDEHTFALFFFNNFDKAPFVLYDGKIQRQVQELAD